MLSACSIFTAINNGSNGIRKCISIYTDSKLNHFSLSHSGDSDSGVLPAVQLYTPSMLKNQPLFISTWCSRCVSSFKFEEKLRKKDTKCLAKLQDFWCLGSNILQWPQVGSHLLFQTKSTPAAHSAKRWPRAAFFDLEKFDELRKWWRPRFHSFGNLKVLDISVVYTYNKWLEVTSTFHSCWKINWQIGMTSSEFDRHEYTELHGTTLTIAHLLQFIVSERLQIENADTRIQ